MWIKEFLKKIPPFKSLFSEIASLRLFCEELSMQKVAILEQNAELQKQYDELSVKLGVWADGQKFHVPPGHFYSPIPALAEVKKNRSKILGQNGRDILGIDLNEKEQWEMFQIISSFYDELTFTDTKSERHRYFYDNGSYCYSDAICLYGMIRHLKPKRIIEIGSGYSSCLMLDVNDLCFDRKIDCTFIEPYPQLLLSLISEVDKSNNMILESNLQDVDSSFFGSLSSGDILFVDSTHVSKFSSDVNYLIFTILPLLKSGVYIHFHDIFFPFEYPREWFEEGISWNEAYLLRAFLQYNTAFKISFFNTYLERFYEKDFADKMPLCLKNKGGSIWLRKI